MDCNSCLKLKKSLIYLIPYRRSRTTGLHSTWTRGMRPHARDPDCTGRHLDQSTLVVLTSKVLHHSTSTSEIAFIVVTFTGGQFTDLEAGTHFTASEGHGRPTSGGKDVPRRPVSDSPQ